MLRIEKIKEESKEEIDKLLLDNEEYDEDEKFIVVMLRSCFHHEYLLTSRILPCRGNKF